MGLKELFTPASTREEKARARYEEWKDRLSRMWAAIQATEKRRAAALEILESAASKALEAGEEGPELSDGVREAAGTLQAADALLRIMRREHNRERQRNLSPVPWGAWKPKRQHGDTGPVFGGTAEPTPPKEG